MTRHDEELIIKPIPAPQKGEAATGAKAYSEVLSVCTENVQANMAGPHRSQRITGALSKPTPAIMTGMLPLERKGVKPQSIVKKGKAAYTQRVQENGGNKSEASLAPQAGHIRVHAPETTVERADGPDEPSKRGRGRPRKLVEAKVVEPPTVPESDRQGRSANGNIGGARDIGRSAHDAVPRLGMRARH